MVCVVVNPGWVQTDMGGTRAPTPVEDSVAKMIALADALTIADTGKFLDWTGGYCVIERSRTGDEVMPCKTVCSQRTLHFS